MTDLEKRAGGVEAVTAEAATFDTSFELDLDPEAVPGTPLLVDAAIGKPARRPIIPPNLHTFTGIKKTAKRVGGVTVYRTGFHALRSPLYLVLAVLWAFVGVLRLALRQVKWWWLSEQYTLRQEAANSNDANTWMKLHKEAKVTRSFRGGILGTQLAAVLAVTYVVAHANVWTKLVAVAVVVPLLAHYGRPVDKPILRPAVVTPRHRKLTSDIVLRAYYKAKLGDPEKDGQQIGFLAPMARDRFDSGSQVLVALPYGTTFSEAMKAREKIASGLDVALSQVYLTPDPKSNRSHWLYVADVDPLSIPAGKTPLLDCKPRDIWKAMPLGLDQRGRRVLLPLVFSSILIGAQPRKGKTWTARQVALYTALDPYTRLSVFDGKGSPDWVKFALVAYTYGFGLLSDRIQGDPVENFRATLRAAKLEIQERNATLREMPTSVCPEGKLTRAIARDVAKYNMPVWLIVIDEFQEYLNTGDPAADQEIAENLVFLVKVGPSVGILPISSTQRPSGLGSSGRVQKAFTDYRDNHLTRFALKTGSWQVSDLVLGAGAYTDGWDSSTLPVGDGTNGSNDYRGIGILYEAPVDNAVVRTYLADGEDAERILLAARRLREAKGTLDGMAAGVAVAAQARDPLADVLDAFGGDETFVSWDTLAARLTEQLPERYAKLTPRALSDTIVGLKLGVESKSGSEKGREGRPRGAYRAALDRAMKARETRDE